MKFNNVFVVDDDKIHHFIIRKLLESNDIAIEPVFFENGLDAINDLKEKINNGDILPDLILLDINMPVLDGWQFLEEYIGLRIKTTQQIVIHIISSSDSRIDIERAESYKDIVGNYFVKPMTSDAIKSIFLS
ncbi:response regulator [Flavobacterium sangjuense]|uniref:Regulator of RpoS n=1 Tax=Flavobacterium sangjuense TaxID=2518177 RepID=A0A4P7PRV0_9FLAO|nr:response regulator [Flavobacterium sangjuense]QBZ96533.1 Regulator of RpoS [Flavobacterium sangjuense]